MRYGRRVEEFKMLKRSIMSKIERKVHQEKEKQELLKKWRDRERKGDRDRDGGGSYVWSIANDGLGGCAFVSC